MPVGLPKNKINGGIKEINTYRIFLNTKKNILCTHYFTEEPSSVRFINLDNLPTEPPAAMRTVSERTLTMLAFTFGNC